MKRRKLYHVSDIFYRFRPDGSGTPGTTVFQVSAPNGKVIAECKSYSMANRIARAMNQVNYGSPR